MINFRFHIVSLVAVFLALALGIVIGSTVIDRAIVDNLNDRLDTIKRESSETDKRNDELELFNQREAGLPRPGQGVHGREPPRRRAGRPGRDQGRRRVAGGGHRRARPRVGCRRPGRALARAQARARGRRVRRGARHQTRGPDPDPPRGRAPRCGRRSRPGWGRAARLRAATAISCRRSSTAASSSSRPSATPPTTSRCRASRPGVARPPRRRRRRATERRPDGRAAGPGVRGRRRAARGGRGVAGGGRRTRPRDVRRPGA